VHRVVVRVLLDDVGAAASDLLDLEQIEAVRGVGVVGLAAGGSMREVTRPCALYVISVICEPPPSTTRAIVIGSCWCPCRDPPRFALMWG
jgi:hypothetical protein